MKFLLLGVAMCALFVPAVQAQTSGAAPMAGTPTTTMPGRYQVFFAFNSTTLDPQARQTINQAAVDWRRTGTAQISVIGHTDTSGSSEYNQRLSERRADAVQAALIEEGVPAGSIVTLGRGQEDLLVPTADGVREPENRRVEIVVPQPPPAPEPMVEATAPPPPPPPPEPARWTFALGAVYGHHFGATGKGGGDKTQHDLAGGGVSLKQMALWSFNGIDDGLTGRSVVSLDLAPDFGIFRPTLAINGGGVYGMGVQDGFVVGPEIRFDIAPVGGFNIGIKAAYDYQFRNAGWDEGILWAGLDLGIRF